MKEVVPTPLTPMERMQRQRLGQELLKMNKSPPEGICVSRNSDRYDLLEANITGPAGTPYDGGVFNLQIIIPEKYPFLPPSIKFVTRVYHPNIDDHGRVCLDLIKMPPAGNWKPTLGLEGILIAVRMLLEFPNPDDPLMTHIAEEFKRNNENYVTKAKSYTEKYAQQ
ncbi:hypothetical protein NQ315_009767 [Exocentrus adspersus]|uniref:Ubiquitin-conjugating enzyme E2 T n=1 Tax=Exocentrus adspersus TaxID=1586481 RepID=A0AAV8WGN0_9CUCU|nr:hypothetical protein NQ315_009767 [Exocentrus adspersus]